jgi:pyridoxal 5'-phosphate synthase pdxT subunit
MRVGVLALQGAVREHRRALEQIGVESRAVKTVAELAGLDGLILPGGESTAMALLAEGELLDLLRRLSVSGFPMFGTCAGMILLADEVDGRADPIVGGIDIAVARNASGRQVDSFETTLDIDGVGSGVPAVFIRAPYITRVGPSVRVLSRHQDVAVMARQGRILVASFHPELTDDVRVHQAFVDMICERPREGEQG